MLLDIRMKGEINGEGSKRLKGARQAIGESKDEIKSMGHVLLGLIHISRIVSYMDGSRLSDFYLSTR